jgi:hypothetical protein
MRRFFITVAVGALVYTAGSFITPQEDSLAIVFAPIAGSIFTAIVIAVLLLPLRAGLRAFMPQSTQRTYGIIAASVLLALVTAFSLVLSAESLPDGRLSFWALWAFYVVALAFSFFWPLATQSKIQAHSVHDHAT